MNRRLMVLLLVFALVFSLAVPALANPNKGPAQQALAAFDQRIVNTVDVNRAMEHIRYMSKEIGTRPGGMPNEKLAADYILNYFEGLGYETQLQPFSVGNQNIGTITLHDAEQFFGQSEWGFNEWHGTVWETGAKSNGLITGPDAMVSGYVVDCGTGQVGEFPSEVEGNFALVERASTSTSWTNGVITRANEAGAAGILFYAVTGSRGQYGSAFNPGGNATNIPVLGLALAQGMWLKEMVAESPLYVDLQTQIYTNLTSHNVVATKPAKIDNAPIVVIGGHFDSVVGAPGANDNLSGTAVVMELARIFKGFNTDNFEIRFAAWGSEERGLVGATRYVNTFITPEERARHIACYNADMVATSEYERGPTFFLETVDGLPNLVTDTMLSAADRLGYDFVRQSRFSSSDHVPFHNAGIPAALFIYLGGQGIATDYTIERFYHTPQDTIEENLCVDRLDIALKLIGSAVYDVVRKETPALTNSAVGRNR